jgi:hypothetical protein
MAEGGGIKDLLGDEKEGAETEVKISAADPVAVSVAMDAAKTNSGVAESILAYLKKQSRLIDFQLRHFEEERVLAIAAAKRKRYADRIRNTLMSCIALAVGLGLFGLLWMIRDSVTSRQVVIAPFDLSPSLASRNITGKIVAAGILDDLNRLQAATQGSTQKASLTSAWDRDIKIEVPETGISIGEISRMLRERFGHDVRIDGDLVETPTQGLALTVRGTGIAPKSFIGTAVELQKLTRDSAEYVYGQSQPALWAAYLVTVARLEEAIAFARTAIGRTEPSERARVFDMWSDALASSGGSLSEALSLAREAVKLNPDDWGARNDVMLWLVGLGDEEGAIKAGNEMQAFAGGRPGRAPELQYLPWDFLTWNLSAASAGLIADLNATGGIGTNFGAQWPYLALLHDPEAAQFTINNTRDPQSEEYTAALVHHMNATLAHELGNDAVAAKEWEAVAKDYEKPGVAANFGSAICHAAPALERVGRHTEADAALEAVAKLTFVDCYRFKGDILDSRGNWAGAQEWYAKAVKLGPSLPAGYYSWGLALAKHGDLDGAVAKFKNANQKGPRWADPLKAWGDVLAKQGKTKDALAKYDEAIKCAPNWKQLKEARAAVAKSQT